MKDINRYSSIEELNDQTNQINPTSTKSAERHDKFEQALRLLRQDYLKSNKFSRKETVVPFKLPR